MNRFIVAVAALGFLALGIQAVSALTPERAQTGYALTYALNGTPKWFATYEDDAGVGCVEARLDDGINTMVQCDNATYVMNARCVNDGGTQAARAFKVAADEKYPMGLLTVGQPYVSVETATASTKATCKFFHPY